MLCTYPTTCISPCATFLDLYLQFTAGRERPLRIKELSMAKDRSWPEAASQLLKRRRRPLAGVTDFCRCELPRLLPPICTASQCFYSDGVGHKKSKKQRRNQSKCRFHWTLMDVLGSPWICRLRDYSALTRLAPAGPPSKTPAFNFAWRRSCRTRLLSVGGSNGRRRAVETWRGFPKFLWGFAG